MRFPTECMFETFEEVSPLIQTFSLVLSEYWEMQAFNLCCKHLS